MSVTSNQLQGDVVNIGGRDMVLGDPSHQMLAVLEQIAPLFVAQSRKPLPSDAPPPLLSLKELEAMQAQALSVFDPTKFTVSSLSPEMRPTLEGVQQDVFQLNQKMDLLFSAITNFFRAKGQ